MTARCASFTWCVWALAACATESGARPAPAPHVARAESDAFIWAATTSSPSVARAHDAHDTALLGACGASDASLDAVAATILEAKGRGEAIPDAETLALLLRAEGEPHTWPRAFFASEHSDTAGARDALAAFRAKTPSLGEARCGVATKHDENTQRDAVAAVLVDALADLDPLPTRTHAGSWLTLSATLHVPARGVEVVLLGPRGAPRHVPASLNGDRVLARFAPDQPGAFTVQLLADVRGGPRPVLEAMLFADVDPPARADAAEAPGETAASPGASDDAALFAMLEGARQSDGREKITRDGELDALATAHAGRMMRFGEVAHDAGDGDPRTRLEAASYPASRVGENAAHATSIARAHRALWSSPSHRENLLGTWDHAGVGAVRGADGSVWVVELFAR